MRTFKVLNTKTYRNKNAWRGQVFPLYQHNLQTIVNLLFQVALWTYNVQAKTYKDMQIESF